MKPTSRNKGGRPAGPPSARLTADDLAALDRIAKHLTRTRGSGDRTAALRYAVGETVRKLENEK